MTFQFDSSPKASGRKRSFPTAGNGSPPAVDDNGGNVGASLQQQQQQQPLPPQQQPQPPQQQQQQVLPARPIRQTISARVVRQRYIADRHTLSPTLYEQWCADANDRPIMMRTLPLKDDGVLLSSFAPLLQPSAAAQQQPPRIVYFLEPCDQNNAVAWHQMSQLAHCLRSMTAAVFPLLHQRVLGVYWVRPKTVATSSRAFSKDNALYFNAAAIDASDAFQCYQVVCHELAHAIDKAHNGRFVTASEMCARAHFPAFWGFYINHLIGERDCEFVGGSSNAGGYAGGSNNTGGSNNAGGNNEFVCSTSNGGGSGSAGARSDFVDLTFLATPTPSTLIADTATATPTFVPATFRPTTNAAFNNVEFATVPTRIAVCKRKRTTAPSEQRGQSIQGSNNRNNNTNASISRSTHLQTPILFETDIVDAPTKEQREQHVVKKRDLESTEETDDEEDEQRTTLVETRSPTPIERIAFYVEKHHTPDWRKMHLTARRLRSLTACVFPVLHLLTIGVYWSGVYWSERKNQEAFVRDGALFFNADALCVCSDLHLFLVVCRALCSNANREKSSHQN